MAGRNVKPRNFFEPWVATKSKAWELPYKFGPPRGAHLDPQDLAQQVAEWESQKLKAEADAEWLIWGSGMSDPSICVNLSGSVAVMGSERIIAISKINGLKPGAPSHEAIAKRIAACVTACAGIGDPESFISDARAFFLALLRGDYDGDPRNDSRVLKLLARCIPPSELEEFSESAFE